MSGLIAELAPYAIAFVGLLAAFFGYKRKVVKDTKEEVRDDYDAQQDKYYNDTRKEMDNATPIDTNAANARDRLREWTNKRGKPGQ